MPGKKGPMPSKITKLTAKSKKCISYFDFFDLDLRQQAFNLVYEFTYWLESDKPMPVDVKKRLLDISDRFLRENE